MAPLIILLVTFCLLVLLDRFVLGGRIGPPLAGRIAMAAMLVATGISHFTNTDQMVAMMPDFVPAKRELVYFTGLCELAAVVGLVWNKTARLASVLLIVFFVLVLPANIAGSLKSVNFGGMEYGAPYLLLRVPMQVFFIWWVWFYGLRLGTQAPSPARVQGTNDRWPR